MDGAELLSLARCHNLEGVHGLSQRTNTAVADRPNIIFIMADDLGYGDVGCFNPNSKIPTPNVDRLAWEGIRFTDAHSPSAVCTPTRYGVLTGRYCWRSELKHGVLYGYEPPLIEPNRLTVAALLKNAGYNTACVGKWHLGLGYSTKPGQEIDFDRPLPWGDATREEEEKIDFSQRLEGGPTALGFDYFFGTSGCATAQPPYGFIENDRFVEAPSVYRDKFWYTGRPGMTAPSWEDKDVDPTFVRKAVEYIEAQAESEDPFFLYLTPSAPHEPCLEGVVPEFARDKSQAGPRGDLVWLVDWMVGQVLDALDRTGQGENTLVIFTSDNGALPGDRKHGADGETAEERYNTYGHRSCGDWRGYKAHIWEGGHREPLVARWPGKIQPGAVSDELICLTDFMATCAAIVDRELPDGAAEDSFNALPVLLDEAAGGPIRESVIHHSCFGVFSIRRGDWKLVEGTKTSGGWPPPRGGRPEPGAPGQLYDLKDDPREQNDLWERHPDMVEQLTALLDAYREHGRSRVPRSGGPAGTGAAMGTAWSLCLLAAMLLSGVTMVLGRSGTNPRGGCFPDSWIPGLPTTLPRSMHQFLSYVLNSMLLQLPSAGALAVIRWLYRARKPSAGNGAETGSP